MQIQERETYCAMKEKVTRWKKEKEGETPCHMGDYACHVTNFPHGLPACSSLSEHGLDLGQYLGLASGLIYWIRTII